MAPTPYSDEQQERVLPAYCVMKEDIVVSGISGIFPDSFNMDELAKNLYAGKNCVSGSFPRWPAGYLGLPKMMGTVPSTLTTFDNTFFDYSETETNAIDFQLRFLLEKCHEAILDAGVDPEDLRGSKVGYFLASSVDEVDIGSSFLLDVETSAGALQLHAARIPSAFDFHGPVSNVDVACGSSCTALHQAMTALRTGQCDSAILGAANICVYPGTAMMFHDMSMTSQECKCKAFDASADGYARAEALGVIFLQKKKDAKRIYTTIRHTKANADGYKQEGITFPKASTQTNLINATYAECGINPCEVQYMESHATGTKAGDPVECKAMSAAMRRGQHKKYGPLWVGALKSNIGHTEAASGLAAIAKVIISYENKMIPKNIHVNVLNPDIPELHDGSLKPLLENTPFEGGVVSINNFGFGGANAHAIVESHELEPTEASFKICDPIPRLVTVCGRTHEAVKYFLDSIKEKRPKLTREFLSLINDISRQPRRKVRGMPFRGSMILHEDGKNEPGVQIEETFLGEKHERRPLWFIFTGMGSQWPSMAKSLMNLSVFSDTIKRLARVVQPYGVDLLKLMTSDEGAPLLARPVGCFVSIAATQIALVDLLKHLGLTADGFIGHSIGEMGCAYADGALTAEQTILAAYWRGKCTEVSVPERGLMVAVGLPWEEAKKKCPAGVVAACNNSAESVTIAGSHTNTSTFMAKLRSENIFAKEVDSVGVPFHSPKMTAIAPSLTNALQSIGIKSKPRTSRWISTSQSADAPSDVAYYVKNLIEPVTFYEAVQQIPKNACVIELSPNSIFASAIKGTVGKEVKFIPAMRKDGNIDTLLQAIGQLYSHGFDPLIEKLYPSVKYPVPRGTPFISSMIKWLHNASWYVPKYDQFCAEGEKIKKTFRIKLRDREHESLAGHVIEGRTLYPATGYLFLAWKTLANCLDVKFDQLPIQFENVSFKRATIMPKDREVTFDVLYFESSNNFEIVESGQVIVSGKVLVPDLKDPKGILKFNYILEEAMNQDESKKIMMDNKDVYKELRLRGYDYGPTFQGVQQATSDGSHGKVKWNGDWIAFADAMLQIGILSRDYRGLCLPTTIELLRCDPRIMDLHSDEEKVVDVAFDSKTNIGTAYGIEIRGMLTTLAPRKKEGDATLEKYVFIPHEEQCASEKETLEELNQYIEACKTVAAKIEKRLGKSVKSSGKIDEDRVNEYLESTADEHSLIRVLNELSQNASPSNYWLMVDKLLEENAKSLTHDLLLNKNIHEQRLVMPLIDIMVDNSHKSPVQVLEINSNGQVLTPHFIELMKLQFYGLRYQATVASYSKEPVDYPQVNVVELSTNYKVENVDKSTQGVVYYRDETLCKVGPLTSDPIQALESAYQLMDSSGFLLAFMKTREFSFDSLLSQEKVDFEKRYKNFVAKAHQLGLISVSTKFDGVGTTAVLFRKPNPTPIEKRHVIQVSNHNFEWVEEYKKVQATIKPNEQVWLLGNEKHTGLLGMVMTLRKEPGGEYIRCIINEKLKEKEIPAEVIRLDLQQNVFRDGVWGQMRHFVIDTNKHDLKPTQHAFVNVKNKGDLSSFSWFQSPHRFWPLIRKNQEILVDVYYAPLNFRDIMCATGRLSADAIPGGLNIEDGILGLEFAGKDENGNRVMGMVAGRGMSTTVVVPDPDFLWPIPDNWTMEEASTVPCVYATSYYALLIRAKLVPGESVLIHAGSGGVGLSAMSIAFSMGCEVFTTVGTPEKRAFIKKQFPKLSDDHILNSRDTKFESQILQMTNGKGVDVILNSLSEDKLQATIRCLAANGRFCEIGKFDLSINTPMDLSHLIQNKTFHGVLLDAFFDFEKLPASMRAQKKLLQKYIAEGIEKGVVKPLKRTIFDRNQVEEAFRYMSTGKHMGKVVLRIRDEDMPQSKTLTVDAIQRTVMHPNKSWVITGGLGGFGLELAQWLVERGAKKLVLTSRTGPRDPYQHFSIERMRRAGCDVQIWTGSGTSEKELSDMLNFAIKSGPIGGIFHLAMIISDALMENQTIENFTKAALTKIFQADVLDKLSRKMCPQLDYFVTFSSIVSGKGNAGQANYAFGNSACERICESRRREGVHGLSIQWGAIGDVGFVAETMKTDSIAGTLIQRMPSCLIALDRFLQSDEAVLGSRVRDDDKNKASTGGGNLMSQIMHILGVNDASKIDLKSKLVDLGMDSLMGVEIKLTLERDYGANVSTQEIRNLTLEDLANFQSGGAKSGANQAAKEEETAESVAINAVVLPTEPTVQLNTVTMGKPIWFLPSSEEQFHLLLPVAQKIMRPVFGLNWTEEYNKCPSMQQVAAKWLRALEAVEKNAEYDLVGYSFGGVAGFEMALQLQKRGRKVRNLVMLDSSPQLMAAYGAAARGLLEATNDDKAHVEALLAFSMRLSRINYDAVKKELNDCKSFEERYSVAAKALIESGLKLSESKVISILEAFWTKSHLADKYQVTDKYNGDTMLIRASDSNVIKQNQCEVLAEKDYALSKATNGKCDVIVLEGDHKTFITNNVDQMAAILNKIK